MKTFFYICLLAGALALPTSERARSIVTNVGGAAFNGVEEMFFGDGHAEIRTVDEGNFDTTIQTPGRLIIVDFHHEVISVARSDKSDLDHSISLLPSRILVAKVLAEKNIELLDKLQIHNVPTLRIYRDGEILEEFKGKVDRERFLKIVQYHMDNPNSRPQHTGYIGPLGKNWLPDGVEAAPAEAPITPIEFDSH